jgi:hypothetical protein
MPVAGVLHKAQVAGSLTLAAAFEDKVQADDFVFADV